jgi:hypothetical protein
MATQTSGYVVMKTMQSPGYAVIHLSMPEEVWTSMGWIRTDQKDSWDKERTNRKRAM